MKKVLVVLIACIVIVAAAVMLLSQKNEDTVSKDPSENHYQKADELYTEEVTTFIPPSDPEPEESNIGKQIIHDDWGYTLKDFYFSDTLPEGVEKSDCADFSLPDLQPDEEGVERWVKALDHLSDDGSYDGAFDLDYVWLIVEIDIQNLTGEAQMERWGTHSLHLVLSDGSDFYPYGNSSAGADWYSLHENCGVRPDGYDDTLDYYCTYYDIDETRTARFGWLVDRRFAEDDVVRWINLDVWGYSLESQDKVGHLFLR